MSKLGILGVGKMGGAILKGLISSNIYSKDDILLGVHREEQRKALEEEGYEATTDLSRLFSEPKLLLLSVKPQTLPEVLVKSDIPAVISICAGISIEKLSGFFPKACIVRAMPNTPAFINEGVTTYCSNDTKSPYYSEAKTILESVGRAYPITEDLMDATLPLNGSMPAYLYYFAKCFMDEGIRNGIDPVTARNLTADSIKASAMMILNSSESVDTLIQNVCSKGGTTIAGLNKLQESDFKKACEDCFNACKDRSIELGK